MESTDAARRVKVNPIEIRPERSADLAAIREVNRLAFGQEQEGNIVDALRANGAASLSLVATMNGRLVGHILYSPVSVGPLWGEALGPMAVLPEYQNRGIGSRLVEEGNRRLKNAGCPFVVLVGHPAFYPRFGFQPASRRGIACEFDVHDDVFMVLVLDAARMKGVSGVARYRAEFSSVT